MNTATAENETHADEHAANDAHHSHEKPRYDDINTPIVVMVGFISAVLSLVTIFFVQGLYYQWENRLVRDRSTNVVNVSVKETVDKQRAVLDGNAESGVIPISEAMDKVVEEFGKK